MPSTARWLPALVLSVAVATACAPPSVTAQGGAWVALGQRTVTDRADHDVVAVTGMRGDFNRIKFTVQRASVDFRRVVVHFADDTRQEIELRHTIPAGGESRSIDLERHDRIIRSVEFWYDANTLRGRRGVVRVLGQR